MLFWEPIQSLQRVPRLACSVASLSWYLGHKLLKCHSLHCKTLTGHLSGKELPSAYTVTHSMQHCIPAPQLTAEPKGNQMPHCGQLAAPLPRAMLKLSGILLLSAHLLLLCCPSVAFMQHSATFRLPFCCL